MKKLKRNSNSLRDYFFSHFGMTKRQRSGFFVLIFLILGIELIIQFYPFEPDYPAEALSLTPSEEAMLLKETPEERLFFEENKLEDNLKVFNPNALDEEGFMALGFSQKQANSLIKYRYSLGGNFSDLEEFSAAYVVSERMFQALEPFIQIEPYQATLVQNNSKNSSQHQNKNIRNQNSVQLKAFDPNTLSQKDWQDLGFSERQAASILNFKNSMTNKKFENLAQIKACYVINDYMFNKIKDYVRFPHVETKIASQENIKIEKLNPDILTSEDWQELGWDKENADNIIKYKEFIGGFKSLEDLENCQYISNASLENIKNRLDFPK